MLACPSISGTLAMSAAWSSAFVAAVARRPGHPRYPSKQCTAISRQSRTYKPISAALLPFPTVTCCTINPPAIEIHYCATAAETQRHLGFKIRRRLPLVIWLLEHTWQWYSPNGMFRKLIIQFIILWLPLQGVIAAVMPFCEHGLVTGTDRSHLQQGGQGDHSHHASSAVEDHSDHGVKKSNQSSLVNLVCDDCGVCHLACATFISAQQGSSNFPVRNVYQSWFAPSHPLLFPEQPLHPPKFLAA